MKENILRTIGIILFVGLLALGGYFIDKSEKNKDIKTFNEGACTECDGSYKFSSASGTSPSNRSYYYTCDKCGHTIEVSEIMK